LEVLGAVADAEATPLDEHREVGRLLELEQQDPGAEHLQLGWDAALAATERSAAEKGALAFAPGPPDVPVAALLPAAADPYFRAERVRPGGGEAESRPSFAVLVVIGGEGSLRTERGDELAVRAGSTALIPFGAGSTVLSGELEAIRCLPPDPGAAERDS